MNVIRFIKEFLEYRKLKKELTLWSEALTTKLKLALQEQNKDLEKEVWEFIIWNMVRLHFREELSYEYMRGYRDAINFRIALIRKYENG